MEYSHTDINGFDDIHQFIEKVCLFIPVNTVEAFIPSIAIFPNPVWSSLTITSEEEPLSGDLMIYNAVGQLVHQQKLDQVLSIDVDWSDQPAGAYYLVFDGMRKKLIKVE